MIAGSCWRGKARYTGAVFSLRRRFIMCLLLGLVLALAWLPPAVAGPLPQASTPTPPPLRVEIYDDVNVRAGPGTYYDLVGRMIKGQMGEILGRSSDGFWLKIVYIGGPDNTGWVYRDLVRVVGDIPSIATVIAPPTPTLPPTSTSSIVLVGTLTPDAAAGRLPTFTPPSDIVRPTLLPEQGTANGRGFPPAVLIISLFVLGVFGGMVSLLRRRT